MEDRLDDLLRHALTPEDEPNIWLNQKVLNRVKEQRKMVGKSKKRFPAAAVVAVLVLCLSSITVYAAIKFLPPAEVAEEMQDQKLAEVLLGDNTVVINETQNYGDYNATLLSIVSGELLSEYPYYNANGSIVADRTYAVVAIEKADGTPMPDTSEEAYGELEFFVSPLIGDYNPAFYNIASMSGNYADIVEDGILYRLLECDNVEKFAEHNLYLCVTDGAFYNEQAYCYDSSTGIISRNEKYDGLNALFELPIDSAKANPEKAAEYIASIGFEPDVTEGKQNVPLENNFEVETQEGNETGVVVAEYALQFVGNPYAWGESSLTEGTDSSGFTKSVFEHFGVELPHDSKMQDDLGVNVSTLEEAVPGDLIFYDTPAHVAIFIGKGMVVHALPQEGICISDVNFDEIISIRRIITE